MVQTAPPERPSAPISSMLSPAPKQGQPAIRSGLAWMPIPTVAAAIAVLYFLDLRQTYASPQLLLVLIFVFSTLVSLFVAYLVDRSFRVRCNPGLLILACGILIWASSGLVGTAFVSHGPNVIITIHNSLVWLSALCQLGGALLAMQTMRPMRAASLWATAAYTGTAGIVGLVTVAALAGWLPDFFVQGQGGTPVRQAVLGSAIAMFALTAVLLWVTSRMTPSRFSFWYSQALALIAIGLLGVMLQASYDSILGWTGRTAQFIGGLYMLFAAIASVRETHAWEIPLQAALSEARLQYSSLVETSPDAIAVHVAGDYVFVNPAAVRLFGAAGPEEIVGRQVLSLVHPDDRQAVAERMRQAAEHVQTTPFRQFRVLRLDGLPVDVETAGSRIEFQGRPAVQVVLRDITDRKRAEEALRENEERYRKLFEGAPFGVGIADLSGRVLAANPAMAVILGYTADEVMSLDVKQLYMDCSVRQELIEGIRRDGCMRNWQAQLRRKDGTICHARMSVELISLPDHPDPVLLTNLEDITERKQAEDALRKLNETLEREVAERTKLAEGRAKQLRALVLELTLAEQRERRRLAEILHDHLQQILIAAKINSEILSAGIATEQKQTAENILNLITQSIQTSRSLTAELSPPILQQSSLSASLGWLGRWMQENYGLTVELQTETALDPPREDVTILLFQSIRELLFNVVKHAGVKSARIEMVRDKDNALCVSVMDGGSGFNPGCIWESANAGTGFGLFSIRERLELLGGSLQIESSPGNGAACALIVPLDITRQITEKPGLRAGPDQQSDLATE